MKHTWPALLTAAVLFAAACDKAPNPGPEPKLKLLEAGPGSIYVGPGINKDTLFVRFEFTDGDGDIIPTIFLKDLRDSTTISIPMPRETNQYSDPVLGLKGIVYAVQPAVFLRIKSKDTTATRDTVAYGIHMEDQSGHKSLEIRTPDLILYNTR